ncbi:uncharacterized protein MYCGRDRAFT_91286 [Zymoseptoria tritici IPO323]|uniref:Uncharacterized protein n=1 Tax=Zymoseptoria tritici (strain CBS 115943 / IPO323) TaxID=336722 RepID=F9X504_ZYMTI|nr:uncharacterized protein MYCGRDRAFT_91286 [Zymoseptoria tritici IPO323]EGP90204.1 hypothetical protein MYCGRDRAFT_91286 [Zymoseptoria tritici IPO323]
MSATTERITIGVVGRSGSGKSATLNSEFQVGEIARYGGSVSCVTFTTNLYCGKRTDQISPLLAEVFFFTEADRYKMISRWIHDYDSAAAPDPTQRMMATAAQLMVCQALETIFKDHPECEDYRAVYRFLDDAKPGNNGAIGAKLVQWSNDLLARTIGAKKTITVTGVHATDLLTQLRPYDSKMREGPSLWPFVSLIRFHVDNPLTAKGIHFLDTPGHIVSDFTRQYNAARYRLRMRHLGKDRVVVVVTKTDIIGDHSMSGSLRDEALARKFKDRLTQLEAEDKSVDIDMEDALEAGIQSGDLSNYFAPRTRHTELKTMVRCATAQEKVHRIKMRGEIIFNALQPDLFGYTESPVPVCSVSDSEYAKHVDGYEATYDKEPFMSLEETDIPNLRRLIGTFV